MLILLNMGTGTWVSILWTILYMFYEWNINAMGLRKIYKNNYNSLTHNSQQLEKNQMSITGKWISCGIFIVLSKKEWTTDIWTMWINLKNGFNKRSQIQKYVDSKTGKQT